jgi:hypothetical protein
MSSNPQLSHRLISNVTKIGRIQSAHAPWQVFHQSFKQGKKKMLF